MDCWSPIPKSTQVPFGSGLAREYIGSGDESVEWATAFASKPAPTWVLCVAGGLHPPRRPVGAGLLANTLGQAMKVLDGPLPSRASPLPHGVLCVAGVLHPPRKPVGAGLLAKRPVAPPSSLSTHPPGTLRLATTAGSWPWRFPATDRCAAICSANWRRARADTASPPTCAHRPGAGFCRSAPVRCIR